MEEDGGNYIFKLSSDRDRDSKYTTRTSAMKRSDGILVTGVKQVLGVWEEYFKKLLNLEGECEIEMMRELEVRTITEEEVEKTVKKMKTWKAVDELSVEMVKANELMGIKWLTRLFNACYTTGEIPAEWRRGVIVPIWKGKGTSMPMEIQRHHITEPSPEIYGRDTGCEGEAYSGEQHWRELAGI